MNYTPGPWKRTITARPGYTCEIVGAYPLAGALAGVYCIPEAWGDPEANARLFAAAPAMYEHLKVLAAGGDAEAAAIVAEVERSEG